MKTIALSLICILAFPGQAQVQLPETMWVLVHATGSDAPGIYNWDSESDTVISYYPLPNPEGSYHGLYDDGDSLWVSDFVDDAIYQLDRDTGSVLSTLPGKGADGIAPANLGFWVGDDHTIELITPEGTVLRTIQSEALIQDIASDGEYLYVITNGVKEPIIRIDIATEAHSTITADAVWAASTYSLAWFDDQLLVIDNYNSDNNIRGIDPKTGESLGEKLISIDGWITALAVPPTITRDHNFTRNRIVPHVSQAGFGFETELLIANRSARAQEFKLNAYDAQGSFLSSKTQTLAAGGVQYLPTGELFDNEPVSHVQISDESNVSVLASYRSEAGFSSQVRETTLSSKQWMIFPGDWGNVVDAFAAVNTSLRENTLTVSQIAEDGSVIASQELTPLIAKGKLSYTLSSDFSAHDKSHFLVSSTYATTLVALRFSLDNNHFWENPALAQDLTIIIPF